jgi:hypothetical protein
MGVGVTFENDSTSCCDGGAAYLLGGNVSLTNTTVSGSAGLNGGAAITNGGATLTLVNATLADNGADIQTDTSGITNVKNTILGTGGFSRLACEAPGRSDSLTNGRSGNAITNDGGNNIAQDNSCNLTATGDLSSTDPKLASIADNGGPTRTQALLHGSPARGAANQANCPASVKDQRGLARANPCDIGAFEAQILGPPSVTTGSAQNLQGSQADLHASVNFSGEAGALHFLWGTSPGALSNSTASVGQGQISVPTDKAVTLSGLSPGTTYYYEAVADNGSGTASGTVQSFTAMGPPVVSGVRATSVTDTTATIQSSIDPQNVDTSYVIIYGPDSGYGQRTSAVDIGSTPGFQQLTATLTGLTPGATYHFDVVATNQLGTADGGDQTLTTDRQIAGIAGSPVTLTDSGSAFSCPAQPTINWGDGTSPDSGQITCNPNQNGSQDYHVSAGHTYAAAGHYPIRISYDDLELIVNQFAQIAPPPPPVPSSPSNTAPPTVTGTPHPGQTLTCSSGSWTNSPTSFAFQWNRDGTPIAGATGQSYSVGAADVSHLLSCTVAASNAGGSGSQTSNGVPVTTVPVAILSPPRIDRSSTAGFSGSVNPEGLPTSAFFQYGLDSRYGAAADSVSYTQSTPVQQVGSDFSSHTVSASVVELVPNAVYHVRMVAINGAGTTNGPDATFTTLKDPPPPPPVLGKSFDVSVVSGVVLIKPPSSRSFGLSRDARPAAALGKGQGFVPLTQARQIPAGSQIDARRGTLSLTAATTTKRKGKLQTGFFNGGIFTLAQTRSGSSKGLTTLSLLEGAFPGAPTYASCPKAAPDGSPVANGARLSSRVLQTLRGRDNHGRFATRGRYSAATVRGTQWDIADRCDGTVTLVQRGTVLVNDFGRHATTFVHAGQSYLAKR